MSGPGDVADRYITRGGGKVQATTSDVASDILKLSSFILWHEPNHLMGGVRTNEAFDAMCRLLNVEGAKIRAIVRQTD